MQNYTITFSIKKKNKIFKKNISSKRRSLLLFMEIIIIYLYSIDTTLFVKTKIILFRHFGSQKRSERSSFFLSL